MKNNIDFYQHYSNSDQHPKFKMLRSEFGWEGEGKFWALNNRIALSENCRLDLSKKYNKASVASDLNYTIKEFELYLKFLIEECELVREIETLVISTDIIQENFERVQRDRSAARVRATRRWEKTNVTSTEPVKISPEKVCKVKETKVKETCLPFDKFWEMCRKKVDKKDCLKIWPKISELSRIKILEHLPKYNDSNPDKQYLVSPYRYLNKEKYNDEIIQSNVYNLNQHQPGTRIKTDDEMNAK